MSQSAQPTSLKTLLSGLSRESLIKVVLAATCGGGGKAEGEAVKTALEESTKVTTSATGTAQTQKRALTPSEEALAYDAFKQALAAELEEAKQAHNAEDYEQALLMYDTPEPTPYRGMVMSAVSSAANVSYLRYIAAPSL